jgi:hypothetical protein
MTHLEEQYQARDVLVAALRRDVVGPGADDELIDDAPVTRYAVGILFPQDAGVIDAELQIEGDEDGGEAAFGDPPVAMAHTRYPSSMGLTFAVDSTATNRIRVEAQAAMYDPEGEPESSTTWRRRSLDLEPVGVDVCEPSSDHTELAPGLELYWRVRQQDDQGAVAVTIALINRRTGDWPRDPDCFFQPALEVRSESGVASFVERRGHEIWTDDEELLSYRLLYRHAKSFAVGHGCAADWEETSDLSRATVIRSAFIPSYSLRLADSNSDISAQVLSMRTLAVGDRGEILSELRTFCDGYRRWIVDVRAQIDTLPPDLQAIARRHINDDSDPHPRGCEQTLRRMLDGVSALADDDRAWRAFQLANTAMLQQRQRTVWHEAGSLEEGLDSESDHAWRPFQLAFILLSLPGLADDHDRFRETVDLLWFPTGGGKTEAYLGLIAFVLFHRRLRDGDRGDGVAVLMRYTLRLLTIQQFERAALLISCCEVIRQEVRELGDAPFLIGLWVGRGGTPNDLAGAGEALAKLRNGQTVEENPVQVHRCPWCNSPLSGSDYWVDNSRRQLRIQCSSRKTHPGTCRFADDLPIVLVDQELYARRPSLVIATVDKFAALPWRSETGRIFGVGTDSRPPELIVQDELHLISGPLGTLTGLYETAVDVLCSYFGRGPKIVASTATIRRADRQTAALFARPMHQFPPPGLDARDSYFAVEAKPTEKPTRMYVGLMAPAVSQTTLMVRAYAALLQGAADLDVPSDVKDPYWTLVGYFNSLRVLGGARMQVQDDVTDRLALLAHSSGVAPREIEQRIELTSRESSSAIPRHLDHMTVSHPNEEALDVILATNMISVGVDIDRLGLMVVMGQPQSTSEYIQSTSRVGRRYPGLVAVLYNASRSRDRSHYESFHGYHSALYRQVESTSVTPFSARARDRGLHAVLIALARLTIPGLAKNQGAVLIDQHLPEVELLRDKILDRVRLVEPDETDVARVQLDETIALWRRRAHDTSNLVFQQPFKPEVTLLRDAAKARLEDGVFPTLWSLRDVDLESNLFLAG